MSRPADKPTWLDRKENVSKIYWGLCVLCAGLLLADLLYHKHVEFEAEGWFGFFPIYGSVGAVVLVLAAKELRRLLMRSEDYYDR